MPKTAIILMDLQRDFLDREAGRMPVDERGAKAALRVANAVLSKRVLADALPILATNEFPAPARVANFLRHDAAIRGTPGAELDPRLECSGSEVSLTKARPSAFANPELQRNLHAHGVQTLYVLGVYAEGCGRASVVEAVKLGYNVFVVADAVASNAAWKKSFALWAMARAGATILPSLDSPSVPAERPEAEAG